MSDQHRAPSCQCKCAHQTQTDAEKQFNTSSLYHVPDGYTPWSIRNDYPSTTPAHDPTPLFGPDPITQSEKYLEAVKTYCLEGMVENDFVPQKNKVNLIDHLLFELSLHLSSALEETMVPRAMDAL
jgi:hypothetical protein